MDRPDWAPEIIDIERPSVARMYDYYLGGSHNFAVDREIANQMIAAVPEAPLIAQANRAFLRRVVRFLLDAGVRQFLDIGSGIPTVGNVHEIAQRSHPEAKVVYVDIDPVAVAHSREILGDNAGATVIQADVRRPEAILNHPETQRLLDFGQPLGLIVVSVLHFVGDDEEPSKIIRTLRDSLPAGSYLAVSQACDEGRDDHERETSQAIYRQTTNPLHPRSRAEITAFFEGFTLIEPGLVYVPLWRPDSHPGDRPERLVTLGGVGRLGG